MVAKRAKLQALNANVVLGVMRRNVTLHVYVYRPMCHRFHVYTTCCVLNAFYVLVNLIFTILFRQFCATLVGVVAAACRATFIHLQHALKAAKYLIYAQPSLGTSGPLPLNLIFEILLSLHLRFSCTVAQLHSCTVAHMCATALAMFPLQHYICTCELCTHSYAYGYICRMPRHGRVSCGFAQCGFSSLKNATRTHTHTLLLIKHDLVLRMSSLLTSIYIRVVCALRVYVLVAARFHSPDNTFKHLLAFLNIVELLRQRAAT